MHMVAVFNALLQSCNIIVNRFSRAAVRHFDLKAYVDAKIREENEIFEKQRKLAGIPDFETWLAMECKKKRLRELEGEKKNNGNVKEGREASAGKPADPEALPFARIDIDGLIKDIDEKSALLEKEEAEEGGRDGVQS